MAEIFLTLVAHEIYLRAISAIILILKVISDHKFTLIYLIFFSDCWQFPANSPATYHA